MDLRTVFGYKPVFDRRFFPAGIPLYSGWGRKPSGKRATLGALENHADFLLLEDGFLRSLRRQDPGLSMVMDNKGIYYDARKTSSLELLIKRDLEKDQHVRARKVIDIWRERSLSKYNAYREYESHISSPYILVVDQTFGDLSIKYGMAGESSFAHMLEVALDENPDHQIILKVHPDTVTRGKKAHFDLEALKTHKRITVISRTLHPVRLIKHADAVYTVTSQIGFEALIWDKRVRCFGMPFYAGWGLTGDELPAPDRRRGKATLEQLVHAALIDYPRYVDPVTEKLCDVERAMECIGLQRKLHLEFPEHIQAVGFSRWKRPFVRRFVSGSKLHFSTKMTHMHLSSSEPLALWGAKYYPETRDRKNVIRLEDGFLRSFGLGANLIPPLSMVVDGVGIYFDAGRPSSLENFLNHNTFTDSQIRRASDLRNSIIDLSLTKYNVSQGVWKRPADARKVLLVVGQVESDASIELGSPVIKSNLALVKRVREHYPDAYIVYKPHPDVSANLRKAGEKEKEIAETGICDEVIGNVEVNSLFEQIDELHTMTSLMGFEALLRGASVVCHGLPFYAGWGLTEDKLSCERRNRRLTIEQMVYGTLIEYPRYLHPDKPVFIEPETAVNILARLKQNGSGKLNAYRKAINLFAVIRTRLRRNDRP